MFCLRVTSHAEPEKRDTEDDLSSVTECFTIVQKIEDGECQQEANEHLRYLKSCDQHVH